jgi:shikimate dehydrogenase
MTSAFAEVIGDPIAQSKSPLIHGFWLEKVELGAGYRPTQVTRAELPSFLEQRRKDPHWRGCNVTMPLKLDAVVQADESTDRAVAAGAANILLPRDGKLLAGNTDVGAVLKLLGPRFANGRQGSVTLLGNGGAARAVLVALRMLDVRDVRIQSRDLAEAIKLAVEFGLDHEPRPFTQAIDSDVLVNATPMGMAGVPSVAIDIGAMPAGGWLFDMVTEPAETPLLGAARARGLQAIDGLAMLVEQAADSFALLFGKDAPRQYDAELMTRLRP